MGIEVRELQIWRTFTHQAVHAARTYLEIESGLVDLNSQLTFGYTLRVPTNFE